MYNEEMTLDNDGISLSDSSNAYSFSETLSPSNQTEMNAQNSIASILGSSNTASLMNNMLNSVLNNNLKQQVKLDKNLEQEDENNLPSSPESTNSLNDEETNEK